MRGVVWFLVMKLIVRVIVNMIELAIVYLVAITLYKITRKSTRWAYKVTASALGSIVASTRTAKNKTKKFVITMPPPNHFPQRQLLSPITESPMESDMSEMEDAAR
jgi:hypothetical protein